MLDTQNHTMNDLFSQLGLGASDEAVEHFIDSHHLAAGECLADAPFWSRSQALFLREAVQDDADWAEIVDQLDARLRHPDRAVSTPLIHH
ncbi:DUF2789 domain-containing protein [Pseudomaricurvus sp. HS19]|uniref:DUF2789 domain-containing protein n=1 Tax=Pseudomaricurvus sp. HS19 TaxID=2692626 RepID=UPI00192885BF|nr:DUF2789 domain-containing protein [Pseudomaricurvus sp. HS19]